MNVDRRHHPYERRRLNVIALVLALVITPTIFTAVVSIAKEPPSAIAGKRATETTVAGAKSEQQSEAKLAAQPRAVAVLANQDR